jgi:hypothetical protein
VVLHLGAPYLVVHILWRHILWSISCGAISCGTTSWGAISCGPYLVAPYLVVHILWRHILWSISCGPYLVAEASMSRRRARHTGGIRDRPSLSGGAAPPEIKIPLRWPQRGAVGPPQGPRPEGRGEGSGTRTGQKNPPYGMDSEGGTVRGHVLIRCRKEARTGEKTRRRKRPVSPRRVSRLALRGTFGGAD